MDYSWIALAIPLMIIGVVVYSSLRWKREVDDHMEVVETFMREIREDLKQIHERLPPDVTESSPPVTERTSIETTECRRRKAENELAVNKQAYEKVRLDMESKHWGKILVMHRGEIVNIFNDSGDAYSVGVEKFGLGNFSLQKVGDKPINLGYWGMFLTGS